MTNFWQDRRVFITGHTGFMGGWLASLLLARGAHVHGYALEPSSVPSFFNATHLGERLASSTVADIRDADALSDAIGRIDPEIVFHLAAQPLVRVAHSSPLDTFSTNVMGTAHVLDALRGTGAVKAVLVVTTDKVYRNENRHAPYSESDRLGGKEPYSASKAACEFVVDAWRHSYLRSKGIGVATIRAGNVFGGGDWAADRLVPDAMRAFAAGRSLVLRYPNATRPWQHVLDPLPGYLGLAERLAADPDSYAFGWNFGPSLADCQPVGNLAEMLAKAWGGSARVEIQPADAIFEETELALDSSKAQAELGWCPRWPLSTAVERTVRWYRAFEEGQDIWALTRTQIGDFEGASKLPA